MRPSSQALRSTPSGQSPSLSYSHATGRISLTAKSCAISRSAFCSSVSVKSTTFGSAPCDVQPPRVRRLTGQSTAMIPGHGTMTPVEDAFQIVLFAVVGVAVVVAVIALVTSGGSYDQIGRGGMSIGDDRPLRPS